MYKNKIYQCDWTTNGWICKRDEKKFKPKFFSKIYFKKYLCVYVYLCVDMCTWVQVPKKDRMGHLITLGLELQAAVSCLDRPNSGLLKEQYVLLPIFSPNSLIHCSLTYKQQLFDVMPYDTPKILLRWVKIYLWRYLQINEVIASYTQSVISN